MRPLVNGAYTLSPCLNFIVLPSVCDVEVRGTTGNLLTTDDGTQVLLTWIEDGMFFSVAGDLTPEQALSIAESLQ